METGQAGYINGGQNKLDVKLVGTEQAWFRTSWVLHKWEKGKMYVTQVRVGENGFNESGIGQARHYIK